MFFFSSEKFEHLSFDNFGPDRTHFTLSRSDSKWHSDRSEEPVLWFCRTLHVIFRLVHLNHNKGMIEQFDGEMSKCKGFESMFLFMRQPEVVT